MLLVLALGAERGIGDGIVNAPAWIAGGGHYLPLAPRLFFLSRAECYEFQGKALVPATRIELVT